MSSNYFESLHLMVKKQITMYLVVVICFIFFILTTSDVVPEIIQLLPLWMPLDLWLPHVSQMILEMFFNGFQ